MVLNSPTRLLGGSPGNDPQSLLGKRVLKDFLDEFTGEMSPFGGTVRSYNAKLRWFLVVYDDGDREELEHHEVLELIRKAEEGNASGSKGPPQPRAAPALSPFVAPPPDDLPPSRGTLLNHSSKRKSGRNPAPAEASLPKRAKSASPPSPVPAPTDSLSSDDELLQETEPSPSEPVTISPSENENNEANALPGPSAAPISIPKAKQKPKPAPKAKTHASSSKPDSKKKKAGPPPSAEMLPPEVELNTRYVYALGSEPWRSVASHLAVPVCESTDLSPAAVKVITDCKQKYYRLYRKSEADETARVENAGFIVDGKRLARRPDRVTESLMKRGGFAVHQTRRVGHVPGIKVNQRFYARSELSCMGMHAPPVAGIDYLGKDKTGLGIPFAVSIVCAGWYEDDNDAGNELIFTGEGGNDLLGSRKQVEAQKLERGNAGLVGNIRLGLPVRVVRKNKDTHGIYGCVLIYDGLYDVVEYWKQAGKEGHAVYQFRLVRRPGQGNLLSQAVRFGGISAPKQLTPLGRPGIVDLDIADGKEGLPIAAVNETDDNEIPPCTALERIPDEAVLMGVHRGITNEALTALFAQSWLPNVEYVTSYHYAPGITPPPAPTLPSKFANDPHGYIMELNHGRLPYLESRNGKLLQLREALPVIYECGPWTGCPLGAQCPQAATQRGIRYRLEIFKTDDGRGWGVRSLDMIPQFAFICDYYGDVYTASHFDEIVHKGGHGGAYSMDMAVRPDRDWDGNLTDERRTADSTEFVICGLHKRNVAAFMNHSCSPNCFVQPVLSEHHDVRMPKISIFASEDIAPFTQLTWDYGEDYASLNFEDGCKCGSEECITIKTVAAPSSNSPGHACCDAH